MEAYNDISRDAVGVQFNDSTRSYYLCRSDAALGVSLGETTSSADLGVSSKYSNENFED